MTTLSPATTLALRIATYEAEQAQAPFIEKEHLFIGLLSLDKVLGKEDTHVPSSQDVAREWNAVRHLLAITGLDPVVLRRLLRQVPGAGRPAPAKTGRHRSPACKTFFDRAGILSEGRPVTCIHLFSAVMERPGDTINGVLAEGRRCTAALRESDVLLPSGELPAAASQPYAAGYDLKRELSADIKTSRDVIGLVPPVSREYALVRGALVRRLVSLALLCLQENDDAGLILALRQILPWSGTSAAALSGVIAELETRHTAGRSPDAGLQERTRELLTALDRQASG